MSGLLTALHALSNTATSGMHLSHMCLGNLGISVASNKKSDMRCFLFHDQDQEDSLSCAAFGRTIAKRILQSFSEEYSSQLGSSGAVNKTAFSAFGGKVVDVIAAADKDILVELRGVPGIVNCVSVTGTSTATGAVMGVNHSTTVSASEIEEIEFLANFRSLTAYSDEICLFFLPLFRIIYHYRF